MSDRPTPYQHNKSHAPAAAGAGPVCEHGPECEVRSLWPLKGESHAEFVARLTANPAYKPHYTRGVPQEAHRP